ncbi:MAG: Trm112 family protein [Deltaproteobacteria bacterium]|jgi:uncharacterized protein|nr:Trm112 family protein [Deltaproteobacteria bacterium]MBT4525803.1 Trm112 family protein [Deltaproteobacteria bacterium]
MLKEKKILEVIACPKCKSKLIINDTDDNLNCLTCKLAYPIKDGIPILLSDEAIDLKKHQ